VVTDVAKGSRKGRKREKTRANARPPMAPVPQALPARSKTVTWLLTGAGALLVVIAGSLVWFGASNISIRQTQTDELTFVGSQACSACHQSEAGLWKSSQHRHAMDHATDASVRGDFGDAAFEYAGTRSRFFRRDRKFLVETDGSDGKLATFEVKYTFGVDPLQQYLVEFPDGRIQALSIAWDTRPKDQGGQRWFHLYPDGAITHRDSLHWTRLHQNWNFMCAECHSTGVRKNYDSKEDRFATSFAEISVGCEACHGAGSRHVAWAKGGKRTDPGKGLVVNFNERAGVSWSADASNSLPRRSTPPASLRKEVETCGLCHARRGQLAEDWKPGQSLSQTHGVSLLDRRLFHADGQMRDDEETYNYAPFKLSKMFSAGVTCSDCHDPHSGELKATVDAVCGQCHAPSKYEAVGHRQHAGTDLSCASCHMPVRSYMVVDRRHDHGFRIPRPDLSVKFGTPNACNDCHRNQSAQWAAEKIASRFGARKPDDRDYTAAFHAVWTNQPDAQYVLATVASSAAIPSYARASAMAELPVPDIELAKRSLGDVDPTVRIGALDMLEGLPAGQLFPVAGQALTDPIRGVRIRAAELLASVSSTSLSKPDRDAFASAAAEFVRAQRLNADRPEARTALGNFAARQGNIGEAEAEYRAALRLDPFFSAAAINLADLYRGRGRDSEGEQVLREAIARSGQDASLRHALGLTLVRLKQPDAALDELRRAAELEPERARYAYVYAVGLQSAGRRGDAAGVLKANLQRHPNDRDSLAAMINFSRETGDTRSALEYAERLAKLTPDDVGLSQLIENLR